jgi:hypothetical protein
MTQQQLEILQAIEEELHSGSRLRRFKVFSVAAQKNTIAIGVRSQLRGDSLDSTLEGRVAAWGPGVSPVVAVFAEDSKFYVHRINAPFQL